MNNNQITVLLPGGFKPCTGAHLDLIQRYSEHPDVKEVKVLVGPGIRDGINQEKATAILSRLTSNMEKVTIEPVTWPSPVLTAYKIIGSAEPGYYTLGASSKCDDYKRVKDFIDKHASGSKYTREADGVHVIELAIDTEPLLFIGRNDEHEGKPISASVLRDDIVNDDFDNFVTGYPNSDPEDIEWVWKELAETVMNETQMTGFRGTTQSTTSGYDRSQPGYYYRSTFPIMEEDDEVQDISEGGGAGHLASPWEHYELTFGEIKDIIDKSLSGELENVTEKLDGQNIMVTFKEGNTYLARTQKQMKNGGQEAIKWDNVYNFFGEKTPERIKIAYKLAISDIQKVLEKCKLDLDKTLKGGTKWLNIELLNPETENIVPYTEFQLRIHNIREVDVNGKEIDVILNGGDLDKITSEIIRVQQNENLDNIHFISKTNSVIFKTAEAQEKNKTAILTELDDLMSDIHLDDKNNIGDYLAEEIRVTLQKLITDVGLTESLIQRWVWESKVQSITQLLKGKDDNTIKVVKKMDGEIDDILGELLDPIITIFSKLGIAVLQNLNGIAASNPDVVTDKMRVKTEEAIKKINEFIKRIDVKDNADFQKKTKYLETQLRRLELGGGLSGIAPIEGIVFEYKGYLLKLTGVYLPILKIINFFQFGKDKLGGEPVNEFERGLDPKRALGVGKYSKLINQIKEIIKDEFDNFILRYKLTPNLDNRELEFVIGDTILYVGLPNLTTHLSTNVTHISTLFQEFFSSGEGEQKLDGLLKSKFGRADYMYPHFFEDEPGIYASGPVFAIDFDFNLENLNEFERGLDPKAALGIGPIAKINNIIKEKKWLSFNNWQDDDYEFFSIFLRFCTRKNDYSDIISYFFTMPQLNKRLMSINPNEIPDFSWSVSSEFWADVAIALITNNYKKEYIKIALINFQKNKEHLERLTNEKKNKILYYLYDNFINESAISESLNEFERGKDPKAALGLGIYKKIDDFITAHYDSTLDWKNSDSFFLYVFNDLCNLYNVTSGKFELILGILDNEKILKRLLDADSDSKKTYVHNYWQEIASKFTEANMPDKYILLALNQAKTKSEDITDLRRSGQTVILNFLYNKYI